MRRTRRMRPRRMRTALQLAMAAGLVGFLGPVAFTVAFGNGAGADSDPGSRFGSFTLSAHSQGYEMSEDAPPAQTHPQGQGTVPSAQADFGFGPVGSGLASVVWPGTIAA